MIGKLTGFADYFRKIPAAFLVAIVTVLALILFLPGEISKSLAESEMGSSLLLTHVR
jgi:peptidoglycan/LPS O-acetylase OafA/YrhL